MWRKRKHKFFPSNANDAKQPKQPKEFKRVVQSVKTSNDTIPHGAKLVCDSDGSLHWIEDNLISNYATASTTSAEADQCCSTVTVAYEPTVTAGHNFHAEGKSDNCQRLFDKVNADIEKGLFSELKIKSESRVCAFTRPNSNTSYMKSKLTDAEHIVVDKISPGENSNSYFARISECTSDNLSKRGCEEFVGCWVSLASSNLIYDSVAYWF